jgi:hypothetical protein
MRGTDENSRMRKESNMLNGVNQKNPKKNKDKRKEQTVFEST